MQAEQGCIAATSESFQRLCIGCAEVGYFDVFANLPGIIRPAAGQRAVDARQILRSLERSQADVFLELPVELGQGLSF